MSELHVIGSTLTKEVVCTVRIKTEPLKQRRGKGLGEEGPKEYQPREDRKIWIR